MADTPKIPDRLARFVQPFYVDAFGSLPPVPGERLALSAGPGLDLNVRMEEMRAAALFGEGLDKKTAQLLAFALLVGSGSQGSIWHARAARRYGASFDELYRTLEIAIFFQGVRALNDGGKVLGQLWKEEHESKPSQ
jgi:alkylhydroperoxidase/carboxymuconolactone decarboxylase family protein YurZ